MLIPAAVLFTLALTSQIRAPHVWVWKLSLLATELGHWLALAALLFMIFLRRKEAAGPVMGLTLTSALIFLNPLRHAFLEAAQWKSDLVETFGRSPMAAAPVISWKSLWLGKRAKAVVPERYVYGRNGAEDHYIEFYRPAAAAPTPWVLVVHAGDWDGGNPNQFRDMNVRLVSRGWAMAAVSYRLAPRWKWPAQKEDMLAAVKYIKASHRELNVDPDRWAVLGRSAGGQIAESVAYSAPDPALKGCIAFYAPADLDFAYRYAKERDPINSRGLLTNLLGGPPDQAQALYNDASPIRFVRANSPPTLLLHGRLDPLTWHLQSRRLYDRFQQAGGKCVFISLPWATHAFDFTLRGPGGQTAAYAVEYFLERIFNPGGNS